MSDWILLNSSHLDTYLMARQVRLLRTVVLGAGENDPVPQLLVDVTRSIRQAVGANRQNRLSDEPMLIPAELQPVACALVLEALQGRIPMLQLSKEQQKAADVAREQLKAVSRGEIPISQPHYPSTENEYGKPFSLKCLHFRRPKITGRTLRGL
jgi:hypothetical protein